MKTAKICNGKENQNLESKFGIKNWNQNLESKFGI